MPRAYLQTAAFTLVVFLSAFLLFVVQPLFAKMVLPYLGGSASVWTACMLFFQGTLFLGYIYAHLLTKSLAPHWQISVHLTLLLSVLLVLPFSIEHFPVNPRYPVLTLLLVAAATVGWPFFIVSTTGPLLQRWFSYTGHPQRDNPYFLYAASNMGSMLALLGYPFFVERYWGLIQQSHWWQVIYSGLIVALLFTCALMWRNLDPAAARWERSGVQLEPIPLQLRLLWLLLAFIPSSLMLGLTSYVTTDLTSFSLFWVVPLALYLLTFIIVFSRLPQPSPRAFSVGIILVLIGVVAQLVFFNSDKVLGILVHTLLFFSLSWFCHERLAAGKPGTSHLTEFYLWLAGGGLAGGLFNALIAPRLFSGSYEYLLVLCIALGVLLFDRSAVKGTTLLRSGRLAAIFIVSLVIFVALDFLFSRPLSQQGQYTIYFLVGLTALFWLLQLALRRIAWPRALLRIAVLGAICLVLSDVDHKVLVRTRSFYGSMQVIKETGRTGSRHMFRHGTTMHGVQIREPKERQLEMITYYHPAGAFGDVAKYYINNQDRPLRIGVVGLGSGVQACFGGEKDEVVFFEIDPKVIAIAQNPEYFTFLSNCPAEIILGDGRIMLTQEPDASFDILFMDAFSSDAVPSHLLTQEALDLYLSKLDPQGVLVIHLSNRYLDLKRVVANYRLPDGFVSYYFPVWNVDAELYAAHSISIFTHRDSLATEIQESERWYELKPDPAFNSWTDDYSNVISALRHRLVR